MHRADFIAKARAILYDTAPAFDTRRVAALGRRTGALTAQEAALIEGRRQFPGWLRVGLGLSDDYSASSRFHQQKVTLGSDHVCSPPNAIGSSILPSGFAITTGRSPDVKVIWGKTASLSLHNNMKAVFLEDSGYIPALTDRDNLWSWQILKEHAPCHLTGRTFVCVVEGSSLFSHWLFDTLPRMDVIRRFNLDPDQFDQVLVASIRAGFYCETLSRLGVDQDRVVSREAVGPWVSCDEFYCVTPVRDSFFADPWVYDFVRDLFIGGNAAVEPHRRIFISRSGAARRRIINEAELYPTLSEFGFEIVRAEDLSVAQTANLCTRTSHIVAPHGAGLSNLVFMPSGGAVLEMYGAHLSTEYWKIANSIGHTYYCLQGTAPDGTPLSAKQTARMGFFEKNALDFRIDPGDFRDAIACLVKSPD